jgi:DNA-binding transcriptional LysR family regulator
MVISLSNNNRGKLDPMELRHLRYFVAVAEYRNFTRAAEHSFVAQPALSQQIARLERELGVALFARDKHAVELTPAGQLLLPHATRILADVELAQAEVKAYLGLEAGQLHMGLIQTRAPAVDMLNAIRRFHERYPAIEVHVSSQPSTEMTQAVIAGTLDLAVVAFAPENVPAELHARLLATDPLVAVVGEAAADGLTAPVSLPELLVRGPLISLTQGSGLRGQVDAALRRAGLETDSRFELAQAAEMLHFAAAGLGVTIVPRSLAQGPPNQGAAFSLPYRVFELADREAVHPVSVVYQPARLSAAAREFLAMLALPATARQQLNTTEHDS